MFQVILYAAIATIVCVVFYSVLGKNVGQGEDAALDPSKFLGDGNPKAGSEPINALTASEEKTGLGAIAQLDKDFSPANFMNGAKAAYSMVLEAYANGDREQLSELLTDDVYAIYDAAISAREEKNQRQVTDLGRLRKCSIQSAEVDGKTGIIQVLYEAELTSALLDEEGNVLQGDPDVLSSISEVWEYQRNMKSSDPAWKLSAVAPSEGDALEADPTPDTKA
ncbi:Tim44/TimA family putative adaptor protein [Litorimonas sp. RW-G-Af-16]|uniref:Tim44/TimA family putative adaptor protein n=1 Tax=Litorimonas sp. RW-G-Af-16 TaxID=3241168 RepID=UPI00390CAEE0